MSRRTDSTVCSLVKTIIPAEFRKTVLIHVTFLKLGEINTLKEQFEADVLIRTKWRESSLDRREATVKQTGEIDISGFWSPRIFVDNCLDDFKESSSKAVEYNENGEAYLVERKRVKGWFIETLELWDFPFDVQDLSVTIMSDTPSTEVDLVEDPEEIHRIYKQSFVDEQEWLLYKCIESEKKELLKDRADPTVRRSALTVKCRAARRPAYFLYNMFLVTFLIAVLAFVTFAVEPNLVQNRLQLSFTLVLTAVAFKFVLNQSLPKISYLTYLDKYILATLIVLAIVCFWHGGQTLISDRQSAKFKDQIALIIFAGIYLVYNAQFLVGIILGPCKKRREMKKKEEEYINTVKKQSITRKMLMLRRKKHSAHKKNLTLKNEHLSSPLNPSNPASV